MAINDERARYNLNAYDFETLFREDLGWNRYRTPLTVIVEGQTFILTPIAERNGMAALRCDPQGDAKIPEYRLRRKIEQEVTKQVQEHLIVFADIGSHQQVWQWVKREQGKPAVYREHTFDTHHQSGDALVQKLRHIAYDLDEEETLTLTIVGARTRKAFDVERVTKKFYELFRKQHADFLKSIQGIDLPDDQAWYASVMLNRLMFVYFIQKKQFLDNDDQYLRNRLRRIQAEKGAGHFHDFYRYFLLQLFHEGLGQRPGDRTTERNAEMEALLGRVPYLNGGIFAPHSLEERYSSIQIEDGAFERIFDFFDGYQWHLDERLLRDDREINPDVLGYIFEKYINQKEMGAYYTKEDITEYIGRNTILPYLFDAAQPECAIAFREDGSVWRPLRDDPDRYIFAAVRKGTHMPLPAAIEAGIADVKQRGDWNRPAPEEYALPTEIWREVVARRQRYAEVRAKLAGGDIHSINDVITYNLDIRQFAQDVVEQCEGPELLRAFWKALQSMRVLDPTVGSGAFLFAALNILEPLYEAVLERMEAFVGDANRVAATAGTKFPDFRQVIERMDQHPNHKHFVYKTIIVNNLFGVDIMEEATEICKLRLFLKLVAQVERVDDLEPLPDIDFNIRAGNTLVGYAQIDDIERLWTATGRLEFERDRDKLEMMAKAYAGLLHDFRDQQLGLPVPRPVSKKDVERAANEELRPELDKDLWRLYRTAGKVSDKMTFAHFRASHNPLHWFVEFPEVMASGGFGVIIGNPPYVELKKVNEKYQVLGYTTSDCADLYALTVEQVNALMKKTGRLGVIVPLASTSVSKTISLRTHLLAKYERLWYASFGFRPSKLFEGVNLRLSILVGKKGEESGRIYSTRYVLWNHDERANLFHELQYIQPTSVSNAAFQKVDAPLGLAISKKVVCAGATVGHLLTKLSGSAVHYHRSPLYWIRAMDFEPYFKSDTKERSVHHFRDIHACNAKIGKVIGAILNSTLFYFQFTSMGNCRNLTGDDVSDLPIGTPDGYVVHECGKLFDALMNDYRKNSQITVRYNCEYQTFFPSLSKPIIDEIDQVLARHYGFTDEELDFIINYDIKYRMGRGNEDMAEE